MDTTITYTRAARTCISWSDHGQSPRVTGLKGLDQGVDVAGAALGTLLLVIHLGVNVRGWKRQRGSEEGRGQERKCDRDGESERGRIM